MSEKKRKSPAEKMAELVERQRDLEEQIKRQRRLIVERERRERDARWLRVGELAEQAGIASLPDDVLVPLFKRVAMHATRETDHANA